MKILTSILLTFLLVACGSTPEPKVVYKPVVKTEYIKGIPFKSPERPSPLKPQDKIPLPTVITPDTLERYYVNSINKSDLTDELKKELTDNLKIITNITLYTEPYIYVGYSTDEYMVSGIILEQVKAWMEKANANMEYVESFDLQVVPDESSGKD